MVVSTGKVTMSQTAALIVAANTNRKRITFETFGNGIVYTGSTTPTLTAASGFPIRPNEQFQSSDYTGAWYGVMTTGGSSTIVYIEEA